MSDDTVLKPDQAAIIWSPEEGFTFLMPIYPEETQVPEEIVVLAALLNKLDDESFIQQLVDEFQKQ